MSDEKSRYRAGAAGSSSANSDSRYDSWGGPSGGAAPTSIMAVEESIQLLDLNDEGEGLPPYGESISDSLATHAFPPITEEGSSSTHSPEYHVQVRETARHRLSEKERLRQSLEITESDGERSISPSATSVFSTDAILPSYEPPAYQPTVTHTGSRLSHSLSKKYGRAREAQITELTRTGLARVDFGSAYAQQSLSTITCALSLYGGALILFGTADGLRVANVTEEVAVSVVWTGLAVWDMRVLRCVDDGDKTPKGSIAILCGGVEDPARPGRPKPKSGEVEVRIWRLGSLASLARWTSSEGARWKGLDMTPEGKKGKGKEKSILSIFKPKRTNSTPMELKDEKSPDLLLAKAWSADWIKLDPASGGKSADVLSFSLRQQADDVYLAIATTSHILLHVGIVVPSGVSFRSTRKFYLPFAPSAMGLLEVLTPTGDPSLGIWISFATGMGGMASVIRNSDSAVLDFKPPSGQGGKGAEGWAEMQNIWSNGKELYSFSRGYETVVYPSPLQLPVATPPVIHTTWPREPISTLVVPDGDDLMMMTTSCAGEICTQRARVTKEGPYRLDFQDGTQIGEGRILPLAWGYVRDGVYVSIKEISDWRIVAIEKV